MKYYLTVQNFLLWVCGVAAAVVLLAMPVGGQVDSDLPDVTGIDGGTCISIDDGATPTPEVNLNFTCSDARIATWALSVNPSGTIPLDRLPIWSGTQAEYDALGTYDDDTLYLVLE